MRLSSYGVLYYISSELEKLVYIYIYIRVYVMKKVCDGNDEEENEIISQTEDINGG
jgi:hypothetical protein